MNSTAVIAGLVAMVAWGAAAICDKLGMRGITNPTVALVVRMGTATGALFLYALVTGAFRELRAIPVGSIVALIGGALLASVIGQGAYFYALRHADASRVVPFTASYPVVALILAVCLLGEPLTWSKVLGTVLVLGGLMLVSGVWGK